MKIETQTTKHKYMAFMKNLQITFILIMCLSWISIAYTCTQLSKNNLAVTLLIYQIGQVITTIMLFMPTKKKR